MKLMRIFTFSLLALSLANCSLEIGIEDISGPDFLKSSVLSETTAYADGSDELIITLELRNSDDSLVPDHTPTMSVLTGASVTLVSCTASNANGISTCRLKSSVPGAKNIAFGNIEIELAEEVTFLPPARNGTFLKLVNSGQVNENAGGYSVTSWVGGDSFDGPGISSLKQDVSGYQIYINTSGAITPTD